jgi:outer membrane receptor protein involved in Fe transport
MPHIFQGRLTPSADRLVAVLAASLLLPALGIGADAGAGTVGAWTLVDLSVAHHPISPVELSLAMNNVFNRMPPDDHSQQGNTKTPYHVLNYNVYGRELYLTPTYKMRR